MRIINAKLVLPGGITPGGIRIRNGKIASLLQDGETGLDDEQAVDAGGCYVTPGLIDLHCHGAGGADFMDDEDGCFETALRMQARYGVTAALPTALSAPRERLSAMIARYHAVKRECRTDLPELLGIHMEGPYFNPQQCGAQDTSSIRPPVPAEYEQLFREADRAIRIWSSAPEIDGALEFGDWLREHGVVAAMGHSAATAAEVRQAVLHGYTHVTHLYSACSSIIRVDGYRIAGIVECAQLYDDLTVELIADGHHLPPELIKLIYKVKGPDKICLVSDSMRAAGMGDGPSILGAKCGGQAVQVYNGVARMPDGLSFAGSVATADQLLRTAVGCGIPLWDAVRMASLTPASVIGVQNRKGSIEQGKDADLVFFDQLLHVRGVLRGGSWLWRDPHGLHCRAEYGASS